MLLEAVPKLAKNLTLGVSKKEIETSLVVTENQSTFLSIEHYIPNMVKLMRAQTILFNTRLFFSHLFLTFCNDVLSFSFYCPTVVDNIVKQLPPGGGDETAFLFESWRRISDNTAPLKIVTEDNYASLTVPAVILASHQVCSLSQLTQDIAFHHILLFVCSF